MRWLPAPMEETAAPDERPAAQDSLAKKDGGDGPDRLSGVLDLTALASFRDAYPSLFASLIGTYLEYLPEQIERLVAAARNGDSEQVRTISHNLKSGSGNVGAARLAEMMRCLEAEAGANPAGEADWTSQVREIEVEARRVGEALRAASDQSTPGLRAQAG